jgi:hypothetical protein
VTWYPSGVLTSSLLELTDLPLPKGQVPSGTAPTLTVGAVPPHPSNCVEIHVRQARSSTTSIRAAMRPVTDSVTGPTQCFSASLPKMDSGQSVDYRVVLSRAGQRLATLPADGSWLSVAAPAVMASPAVDPPPVDFSVANQPGGPRWNYELAFFAALTVDLRAEILGATPEGYRINFFVKEGTVRGPAIEAVVLPEGGDWMCIRPDGIGLVDICITYETTDGALILERAGGIFDLGVDGYAKVATGQFTGSPPFYATPSWQTAHPDWQWLNRRQGFGVGRVVLEELQVRCDIYLPTVGGPFSGN